MGKYIIITVVVTTIILVGLFSALVAAFGAGKLSAEKELTDKNKELEATLRDYQEQLAHIRVERKLAKKGE